MTSNTPSPRRRPSSVTGIEASAEGRIRPSMQANSAAVMPPSLGGRPGGAGLGQRDQRGDHGGVEPGAARPAHPQHGVVDGELADVVEPRRKLELREVLRLELQKYAQPAGHRARIRRSGTVVLPTPDP